MSDENSALTFLRLFLHSLHRRLDPAMLPPAMSVRSVFLRSIGVFLLTLREGGGR